MSRFTKPALVALMALTATPALANNGNGNGNGNGHKDKGPKVHQTTNVYVPPGCTLPPGIQKQIDSGKRTSLPPGIEKNCEQGKGFAKGDELPEGYVIIDDWVRYGLDAPDDYRYAVSGDTLYKIARDAAIVITVVGIANNIMAGY
ncbi:hypothetical protein [Celeribacter litoreus]|uniref:hypothetical protein n=1 Tax=Celeribacter litoreus TaxID=2876714 RepID=UPI001CCC8E03|nr:hypothetical protein [Celeribacter litoreus]MCA0042986.1 hypothetical protein [Celeribacter litoreus]